MGKQCRLSKGGLYQWENNVDYQRVYQWENNVDYQRVVKEMDLLCVLTLILSQFLTDDDKIFGYVIEHIPLKPMLKPMSKP